MTGADVEEADMEIAETGMGVPLSVAVSGLVRGGEDGARGGVPIRTIRTTLTTIRIIIRNRL